MFQLLAMVVKVAVASLLCGVVLSALDLPVAEMLVQAGATPEQITAMTRRALDWALPHIALGAVVIIPVWFLAYTLRPPRRRED